MQSQSITVDRQMKRYDVPRVAFINKLDRTGADPWRVIAQVRAVREGGFGGARGVERAESNARNRARGFERAADIERT